LETATGSVIGADGSMFAIRRELHRPVPKGLFDDIFVSLDILLAGYRVVRAPELRAFEAHATEAADEFRRKVRIGCESMNVHFELWPALCRLDLWNLYKYIGHRLMRWIGGYFLLIASMLFEVGTLLMFGPVVLVTVNGSFLLLFLATIWARFGPAMTLLNVLLALAGNVVGAWRAFNGERAITWEPPASAREVGIGEKGATR